VPGDTVSGTSQTPSPSIFPTGFRWGTATSAHQVEGGNRWNDWWRFEQLSGVIADGRRSGDACRHYERFDEDFARAAADGHDMHRFSIEWSRIEPERGRIDAEAVAHYHAVLASLQRHGLTPLVTLHHFTNPLWIADQGAWESPDTIERFCEFTRFCAREYGREVDWWVTINEPEVYAFRSWSEGTWPPGKRDDSTALAAMANLLEAHGRAYRILHEEDRWDADGDGHAAFVGFAKHYTQLEPRRKWFPLDHLRAHFENAVFNEAVLQAPRTGHLRLSIPGARTVDRHVAALENSLDLLGLNYYTRWQVDAIGTPPHVARNGASLTDLGWEIFGDGLSDAVHAVSRLGKPVLITEHGFADARDAFRPKALLESLARLQHAVAGGAPVLGYLHWSLLDNFEWADGYGGRFGLYQVDFDDPERPRVRTRSAEVYARVCRTNGVSAEALAAATD